MMLGQLCTQVQERQQTHEHTGSVCRHRLKGTHAKMGKVRQRGRATERRGGKSVVKAATREGREELDGGFGQARALRKGTPGTGLLAEGDVTMADQLPSPPFE